LTVERLEVMHAVRSVWPQGLPLFLRISATDWVEGGWDLDQSVELAQRVRESGVDLIDCSSGGASPEQRIALGPGYQVPFAERIRREAGILTAAVGLITTAEQAAEIVRAGHADLVLLARQFLRDPYFRCTPPANWTKTWPHRCSTCGHLRNEEDACNPGEGRGVAFRLARGARKPQQDRPHSTCPKSCLARSGGAGGKYGRTEADLSGVIRARGRRTLPRSPYLTNCIESSVCGPSLGR
jgi:hypothetical protein